MDDWLIRRLTDWRDRHYHYKDGMDIVIDRNLLW